MVFTKGDMGGAGREDSELQGLGLVKVAARERPPWLPLIPMLQVPSFHYTHPQSHTVSFSPLNHTVADGEKMDLQALPSVTHGWVSTMHFP